MFQFPLAWNSPPQLTCSFVSVHTHLYSKRGELEKLGMPLFSWLHLGLPAILLLTCLSLSVEHRTASENAHRGSSRNMQSHLRGSAPLPRIKSHIDRCFLFSQTPCPSFAQQATVQSASRDPHRKLPASSGSSSDS